MEVSLEQIARALNGKIRNGQVIAAGPGHSAHDESLSVTLSDTAEGGFVIKSFANDDWRACKDYVLEKLGLPQFQPRGRRHNSDEAELKESIVRSKSKPVATYDYRDRDGALLYQVLRYEPKTFRQRRPNGKGWIWKLDDRRVVYRWTQLTKSPSASVFVCEGERDSDRVGSLDLCATTVASGKWTDECVEALRGRDIIVLQDNDESGTKKAQEAARLLHSVANTLRVVLLPDLPDKGDVSNWLDRGGTKDQLIDICFNAPLWEPQAEQKTTKSKPKTLNYRRHRDTNNSAPRYLVKNLLPETGVGLLSGQSGTYKTFVGLKLCGCIGTGQPFAGHTIKRQGAALIFVTEGASELPTRLEALSIAEHGGCVLPIYYCDAGIRLLDPASVADVITTAKAVSEEAQQNHKLPLTLILFDTVIAAAQFAKAGDENDAAVGQKLMAALGEISRATNTFVLGIDHFGKAVETGTRGSSAKEAAADVVLALLADKALSGEVTAQRLCIRKRRGGPAGVEHPFTIKAVSLGEDEDGEAVTSLVVEFNAAVPSPAGEEASKWSPSLRLLRKILMTLLATAGERITPFADGPAVLAVRAEFVRTEFFKQHSAEQADTKRKAFDRAVSRAQGSDLIGVREVSGVKWLWLLKQ